MNGRAAVDLEFARDLVPDLQAFDPQPPPAGQAPYRNEDLVRAVAIAAWWGIDRRGSTCRRSTRWPAAGVGEIIVGWGCDGLVIVAVLAWWWGNK